MRQTCSGGGRGGLGRQAGRPGCLLQTEGRPLRLLTSPKVTTAWAGRREHPHSWMSRHPQGEGWEQEAGPQRLSPCPLPPPTASDSPDPECLTLAPTSLCQLPGTTLPTVTPASEECHACGHATAPGPLRLTSQSLRGALCCQRGANG